jgi:hypothetical protein
MKFSQSDWPRQLRKKAYSQFPIHGSISLSIWKNRASAVHLPAEKRIARWDRF